MWWKLTLGHGMNAYYCNKWTNGPNLAYIILIKTVCQFYSLIVLFLLFFKTLKYIILCCILFHVFIPHWFKLSSLVCAFKWCLQWLFSAGHECNTILIYKDNEKPPITRCCLCLIFFFICLIFSGVIDSLCPK